MSGYDIFMYLMCVFCVGIFAGGIVYGVICKKRKIALDDHGHNVIATITDIKLIHGNIGIGDCPTPDSWEATVLYQTLNGEKVSSKINIAQKEYVEANPVGSQIPVRYLPENPKIIQPLNMDEGYTQYGKSYLRSLIICGIVLILIVIYTIFFEINK